MGEQNRGRPERRAASRVVTAGKLPGQLSLDLDTDVLQISVGGMMVEAPMPLEIGSRHGFTISIEAEELDLSGVVRSCFAFPHDGEPQGYRIGVEFCELEDRQRDLLKDFVNRKLGN